MYKELIKRLRELQAITEHCGERLCYECENSKLCNKHDNKTLSGTYKDAADAIEELTRAVKLLESDRDAERKLRLDAESKIPRWIPVAEPPKEVET